MNLKRLIVITAISVLALATIIPCLIIDVETSTTSSFESSTKENVELTTSVESSEEEVSCNCEESFNEVLEESLDDAVSLSPKTEQYVLLETEDISELKAALKYCEERLSTTENTISYILGLGYEESIELIQVLYIDRDNYVEYIKYYEDRLNELNSIRYPTGSTQYAAATFIWTYMKDLGWSDYVCAGILGNIMQETGGRTLDIDYLFDGNGYCGMCCWKKEYHPNVVGADLEDQCAYLTTTVVNVMNSYGHLYREGYTFEDFLAAESIEEAAAAFMIVYERPGQTNPIRRVENGIKAYEYFVGE